MAISSVLISQAISAQLKARRFTGRDASNLASAIGLGLFSYITIPCIVSCSLAGSAGPVGTINSIVVTGLVPASMYGFMLGRAGKKLTGRDVSGLFSAISTGVCTVLTSMIVKGTACGIAVGTGVGNFSAVSAQALSQKIALKMKFKRLLGKNSADLADAIGFGIAQQLKTATKVTVVVTGTIAPVSPTGPVPVFSIPSIFTKIS